MDDQIHDSDGYAYDYLILGVQIILIIIIILLIVITAGYTGIIKWVFDHV